MIFYNKNVNVDYRKAELIIDNDTIKHATRFKLLRVGLDNNLTFTIHCIKLRSSISSWLPSETTTSSKYTTNDAYATCSRLNYCLIVWVYLISQAENNKIK